MTDATAMVVQFPHPGREHVPQSDDMPWSAGTHGRKFVVATGDLVNAADRRERNVDLTCWVEWEPPSTVIQRWPVDGTLPRALHRPWYTLTDGDGARQNTDPWVFGDQMRYSNCRQLGPRPARNPSAMQRLPRGSVILFGSTIDGEFCVDTVFVVASSEAWSLADAADLDIDEAFRTCVADTFGAAHGRCGDKKRRGCSPTHGDIDERTLTLYRGATINDRVEGMYSFVPALRADHDLPRFARPTIDLPGIINPACTQSVRGSTRPLSIEVVTDHWDAIRQQIFRADLELAVHIQTPEHRTT